MNSMLRMPQSLLGILAALIILPMLLISVGQALVEFMNTIAPYAIGAAVLFVVIKLGLAFARRMY